MLQDEVLFAGALSPTNEPPTEVLLFKFGVTQTQKGAFTLDRDGAASVMAHFSDSGVDRLPFDAGHGMMSPTSQDSHKAKGWFVPEIREEGLFATQIEWTDQTAQEIKNREWRFHSPAIRFDKNRRIMVLRNVALTNIPATKNQTPLVLDNNQDKDQLKQEIKMDVLLSTLGASDEAGAVAELNKIKNFESAILSEFGVDSHDAAVDKIKAQSQALLDAQAEVAKITNQIRLDKRANAIKGLLNDGRLLESQREFAATLSDDQFAAFEKTLTKSAVLSAAPIEGGDKQVDDLDRPVPGASFNVDEYL